MNVSNEWINLNTDQLPNIGISDFIIDPNNTRGVKEVTHGLIESFLDNSHPEGQELNNMIVSIVSDSLEEVKRSVLMKEWKIKQKLEEKHKIEEKIKKNKNI